MTGMATVAAIGAYLAWVSWQRWGSPVIDIGHEANIPARLVEGEVLYRDIIYYYGPFSPYLHKMLFQIFGVHLTVLYVSGLVATAIITVTYYWIATKFLPSLHASVATALMLGSCAFAPGIFNYVLPYSYSAVHALTFSLLTIVFLSAYDERRRGVYLLVAGVFGGLTVACKLEFTVALAAAVGVFFLLHVALKSSRGPRTIREMALFASSLAFTVAISYGSILWQVSLRSLFQESLWPSEAIALMSKHFYHLTLFPSIYDLMGMFKSLLRFGFALCLSGSFVVGLLCVIRSVLRKITDREPMMVSAVQKMGYWCLAAAVGLVCLYVLQSVLDKSGLWGIFLFSPKTIESGEVIYDLRWSSLGWAFVVAGASFRLIRDQEDAWLSRSQKVLLVMLGAYSISLLARWNFVLARFWAFFAPPTILLIVLFSWWAAVFLASRCAAWKREFIQGGLALVLLWNLGGVCFDTWAVYAEAHYAIESDRGTLMTRWKEIAHPLQQASDYLRENVGPGTDVLVLPEETLLNFFTATRSPVRQMLVSPYVLSANSARVDFIKTLKRRAPAYILVSTRKFPEYQLQDFKSFEPLVAEWVEANYTLVRQFAFSSNSPKRERRIPPQLKQYSIKLYSRRDPS